MVSDVSSGSWTLDDVLRDRLRRPGTGMPRVRRPRARALERAGGASSARLARAPPFASLGLSRTGTRDALSRFARWDSPRDDLEARADNGTAAHPEPRRETSSSGRSNPVAHLLAGAIGGAASRTATAPLQTIRLRTQAGTMASSVGSLAKNLGSVARTEGWRALFKGNAASVARFAPTKGLDFFTFRAYKTLLAAHLGVGVSPDDPSVGDERSRVPQVMLAGAAAGLTSTALLFPLDNITTRLATGVAAGVSTVDGVVVRGGFRGVVDGLRAVSRAEGVKSLYRGLKPALAGIAPEAALTYGCYDLLKDAHERFVRARAPPGKESATPGWAPRVGCAMVASLVGQTASFPAEVISRRMAADAADAARGPLFVFRDIVARYGWRALFRGIVPASIRIVPMAAISFGTYEALHVVIDGALANPGTRAAEGDKEAAEGKASRG